MFKNFPNRKNRRQILAGLLSAVMILSNMSYLPVQAEETVSGSDAVVTSEVLTVSDNDVVPTATPEATVEPTIAPTVDATSEPTVVPSAVPTAEPTVEPTAAPTVADPNKIDVWDFGAEQLDSNLYNNMLNVDTINSWFPGVEPGTTGVTLPSFTCGDLSFNDGGNPNTHRLRTVNTALTRKDEKSLKGSDGVTYTGYVYSNAGSSEKVYIGMNAEPGDILTFWVGSNGGAATYGLRTPDGSVLTGEYTVSAKLEPLTFYATEAGNYQLYCTNEKLVVARIYREHTSDVTVSGQVTAPAGLSDYSVVFTNKASGQEIEGVVTDGAYSVTLKDNYSYDVSLKNANGYIITSAASLTLEDGVTATDFSVNVIAVTQVDVTGTISGLSEEALAKVKIVANTDETYKPEIAISGNTYTTKLESGISYSLEVENINDYTLVSPTELKADAESTIDLVFEAKPVYDITINPQGATNADLANATFTFTNLKEAGYVYTFTGTENIKLRDGVYSVEVTNSGAYVQKLTSNVKVDGAAVTKTIGFDSDITEWVFTAKDFLSGGYTNNQESYSYNGLSFTGGKSHNNTYLYMGAGTVSVPVKGACQVKVTACYEYSFYFENETEASVGVKTGSTGQLDTYTYNYNGGAGTVDVTFLKSSYVNKIEIVEVSEFDAEISVGTNGDYKTVNDALDAVRKMERPNNERVTITIEPGNYEEMLVIDVPNVTLKNASTNPSIELKNKGVDIADGAVRITHYYGHGYTYYSMGSDCKYDEELLAVNKENGYESFVNPGSGSTAGSYWNATVVVAADGFEAEGIIFENSFNQYVSEKAANDVIVAQAGAKEGKVARADMKAGDITVQEKAYVERAAALAIVNNVKQASFDNCKFVGRQDTLYGGTDVTAAFYDCSIYGGTDYIFGGMTAVFAKCDLVFNTSEDKNDVGYITAAQTKSGRGMLLYNCHITSTTPGVDTASAYTSKPGYLGRPWQANTGEAVFYNTVIDATCEQYYENTPSMIVEAGWLDSLSGQSALSAEYGTYEMAKHAKETPVRASWATVLTDAKLADGSDIGVAAFLGDWDAFAGKDMTIVMPTDKVDNTPVKEDDPTEDEPAVSATTVFTLDTSADLTAFAQNTKADGDSEKAGTEDYFTLLYSAKSKIDSSSKTFDDTYKATQRVNFGGKVTTEKNAIKFTTNNKATVKVWWVEGGDDNRQITILDSAGVAVATSEETLTKNATCISTFELTEAGTYYLGATPNNNYFFKVVVTEEAAKEPVVSTLDTSADLAAVAQGTKNDGDSETAGTDDYFTVLYSAKTKIDGSSKTFDDTYKGTQRINFGGTVATDKNAIKFTTASQATVKVWWVEGGDNNRQMAVLNSSGTEVASTNVTLAKNATCISEFELAEAGTYYLGSKIGNNYIFKVVVTETDGSVEKPERAEWASVAAPVITKAVQSSEDENKVEVIVNAVVGYDGADKITVVMTDAEGKEVDSANSLAEKNEHVLTLTPEASGTYTLSVKAIRDGEADKVCEKNVTVDFVLPLEAPYVSSATNMGGGSVIVEWDAVKEAEKYIVTVDGTEISIGTSLLNTVVNGLTVGQKYTFKVVAVRGEDVSDAGSIEATVVANAQRKWGFAAYGSSINTKSNGYIGNANEGSVTIYSEGGKGKVVPGSTDGLAFYYTTMNPETENFTLTATVTVDSWTYSNGQEGFGLMVADAVGAHGDASTFWNNSYQNLASKIEYYYDTDAKEATTNSAYPKISMKMGVGSTAKTGVDKKDIEDILVNGVLPKDVGFESVTHTLETSCGEQGSGTYNIIGNYTGTAPTGTQADAPTTFRLSIQRNNTGYILRYLDMDGNVIGEQLYYDLERNSLTLIDEDNIYVGFFASRNARITVTDIELTTIHPDEDAPAEEREIEYVTPVNTIESATFSNTADYEMVYYGNADGQLIIADAEGKEVVNKEFTALTKERVNVQLNKGKNNFTVTFVPNAEYVPGEYKEMSSYETVSFTHTVEYKTVGNKYIYVSPNGKANAAGTKEEPMDIYSAVKVVAPGKTMVLLEGTYNLKSTVKTERGIDGTADEMIYMIADPEAESRPVLDFGGRCAGMVLAGDYWYFQGFDVTNSADAQKGIQVSGNNNILDNLRAYRNGNTGIQISRYMGTDAWEDWPANNLILNCTSYLNADKGYEDADGFAAKLTVADGNVFDGCIAAFNADDGWDLFAKVQTGSIGVVTIKNSVAFKNGYDIDEATGKIINAGNGNGFKMGGDSMPGAHVLENSIAFANKAKGIDSNSGPDIQVKNCTSFNNESYNVAFYTNTAANTAYVANGILSFKDANGNSVGESFKLKGSQDNSKVYGTTNYYFDGNQSVNSENKAVNAEWFVNLDANAAITGITRNADGTINMNGFLELTDKAPADAGARILSKAGDSEDDTTGNGTASEDVEVVKPEVNADKLDSAEKVKEVFETVLTQLGEVLEDCDTVEELVDYVIENVMDFAKANEVKTEESNITLVEVTVKVPVEKEDGTVEYVLATEDNFPKDGVEVKLDYPEGANKNDRFTIGHLIVLGCNGQVPGTMEECEYTALSDGLLVHVKSASPFAIAWEKVQTPVVTPDNDSDDDDNDADGTDNTSETTSSQTVLTASTSANVNIANRTSTAQPEKAEKPATDTKEEQKPTENKSVEDKKEEVEKTQEENAKTEQIQEEKTPTIATVTEQKNNTLLWVLCGMAVLAAAVCGIIMVRKGKKDELD